MEKMNLEVNILGKKGNIHYQSGTLYTNSPKYFLKYYVCNEVEECGVYLSGRALTKENNHSTEEANNEMTIPKDIYVPTVTAKEATDKFKTALRVIDIEEVDRIKVEGQILEKIKSDIINIDRANLATMGLIWLFSDKSPGFTAWIATLTLLCNINVYEIIRIIKTLALSDYDKSLLKNEVWQMGLANMFDNPVKREDLKLYMKVKDGNFKFK